MPDPSEVIAAGAEALERSVRDLTAEMKVQNQRGKANRRWIYVVVLGLIINAVIIGIMIAVIDGVQSNSDRIEQVQTRTSNNVLCPLYALILQSYNPNGPTAKVDPAGYEKTFQIIRTGYTTLECKR